MEYVYIVDNTGAVWGSFDSVENAEQFGKTLIGGYRLLGV